MKEKVKGIIENSITSNVQSARWILVLCVFLTLSTTVSARWRPPHTLGGGGTNYSDKVDYKSGRHTGMYSGERLMVGFYANGSYSTVLTNAPFVGNTNGYGSGGGLAIEYQHQSLIFQLGAGLRYQYLKTPVQDTTFMHYSVADTWTNHRDTFHYDMQFDFYRRADRSRLFYLEFPILFGQGLDISTYGSLYYLAGFRLQMVMGKDRSSARSGMGSTSVDATGSTQAYYDRYFGTFREMDNHGMRKDVPIERKGNPLQLRFDAMAHAEIGWEWYPERPHVGEYRVSKKHDHVDPDWRIRVAAFADVSMPSITPRNKQPLCYVPKESRWDFTTYQFNHAFGSDAMSQSSKDYTLRNVFVGVRVTVLIGVLFKEECVICRPYRDERDPGGKKHR